MLVLKRRAGEQIVVDGKIIITMLETCGPGRARIGVEAPETVRIDRMEIHKLRTEQSVELHGESA